MLEHLKAQVLEANLELPKRGLVTYTWGNVSARDTQSGLVIIKPSGLDYERMGAGDMVVVDLDGRVVEGSLRPSSDLLTHLELYKRYPQIGGVVHTHSARATAWAQAGRSIPFYGTTQADYFRGPIPCTRDMTQQEIEEAYELNTGKVIIQTMEELGLNPLEMPAMLCKNHGAFTWGKDAAQAVHNAVVLEEVAKMAMWTEQLNPGVQAAPEALLKKHYERKHGKNAYYGQNQGE